MRLKDAILLIFICLPSIYSSIKTISAFKYLDPFIILGFTGLILMVLSGYMTEIIISMLYIPAATSLILLTIFNYPSALIGLASGYILSFPILILILFYGENSPHIYLIAYLGSILIDMKFLSLSHEKLTTLSFIVMLFKGWSRTHKAGALDTFFSILLAPSTLSTIYRILLDLKPSTSTLLSNRDSLTLLPLSILPLLGLAILSKYSAAAAWIISLLIGAVTTLFLIIYLRVIED